MSERDSKKKKSVRATRLPEVDELLAAADALGPQAVRFDQPGGAPAATATRAVKKAKPRKKRGRGGLAAVLCVAVLLLVGAVVVAEPWVLAEKDTYSDPVVKELPRRTLAVGESYAFELTLGDNERISHVEVQDPDILVLAESGDALQAAGGYFDTTVSITTSEIALPEHEYAHEIRLFGKDFSAQYDAVRAFLRNLIGIEKKTAPRTELRVLARYTQAFTVDGLQGTTSTPPNEIAACLQNGVTLETSVGEGEDVQLATYNEKTATVSLNKLENGVATFTVKGAADTKTKVVATVGFWKEVTPEVYAAYLAAAGTQQAAQTPADGEERPADGEKRENQIFVPQRATVYTVAVTDLSQPVVTANLDEDVERVLPETGHHTAEAKKLLELINALRAENGAPALGWSDALAAGAETRTGELTSLYSYLRPDGTAGTTAAAGAADECIAAGYLSAQEVYNAWLACDSARDAMLAPDKTLFAADFYRNEDGVYNNYWCGLFG